MTTKVKICGLTDGINAHIAADAGADYLGFVFFEKSPRNLNFEMAATLAPVLPNGPKRVGVFVDADMDTIKKAVKILGLDYVQLHGRETPERAALVKQETGKKIIKALAVETPDDLEKTKAFEDIVDAFLFDAKPPKGAVLPGGNAISFPWEILDGFTSAKPWFLAGGLTVENVARAAWSTGAFGLDVSSGVEDAPGKKSKDKIQAFLKAAKAAT